jgi:hypothetical protein
MRAAAKAGPADFGGGVQHDDGDLALGLALVIGVGRPEFERLFLQRRALLPGGGSGPGLLPGPDLQSTSGVGEDVAAPAGVLRCVAFRGDDEIAIDGFPLEQRQ